MADLAAAKKAVKAAKVKGFRKLKLRRTTYIIGRQCQYMTERTALDLIANLESAGYLIDGKETMLQLAVKGLADCITIREG